jgi:Flp pilus assembly protein TadD
MTVHPTHIHLARLLVGSALVILFACMWPARGFTQSEESRDLPQIVKLIEQGKLPEAEARLQTVLKTEPNSPTAYRVLGYVYLQEQRYPEAERALEQSHKLSPAGNPQALFLLVQTKFALKKTPEAVHLARQLSSFSGNGPQIHYALGRMLRENGEVAEGIPELERAHALGPEDPATTTELLIAYRQQQNAAKAGPLLQSFLQTATYGDIVQAGSRMGDAGALPLAAAAFQRATEL